MPKDNEFNMNRKLWSVYALPGFVLLAAGFSLCFIMENAGLLHAEEGMAVKTALVLIVGVILAAFLAVRTLGRDVKHYIVESAEKDRRLYSLAYVDELTQLPNRRRFSERLAELVGQNVPLAVLFIDIDRFKHINDTFGHSTGDKLLVCLAERLGSSLPQADMLARLGSDEYLAILPGTVDTGQIGETVQHVLNAVAAPIQMEESTFYTAVSIGISLFPGDGKDVESLLRAADTAMFQAKHAGRNSYRFYADRMRRVVVKRLLLEQHLHQAMVDHELELYYQPKVNVKTREITGMEALLRWRHKELGFIPPSEFIPVAEETGLIIPLGEWVLRSACLQNKAWHDLGLPRLRMAVNLSPQQFSHPGLVEMLEKILHETGLEPEWLELEITEGSLVDETAETIQTLWKIKNLGIYISIDDFGTGYSSLEYLKHFPIDCLKIDKVFIDDIALGSKHSKITHAIIELAESLNLKVVAEGVETKEQLYFLHTYQCDEAQGYIFSRPVPANIFENMLREHSDSGFSLT